MSPSKKNGNILSFFKPVPSSSQNSGPSQPSAAPRAPLPPPPSSLPESEQSTPAKPAARMTLEIGDSDEDDDDDDDSDDSLVDVSTLIGRPRPGNTVAATAGPDRDLYATPRAKRAAVSFHASPLAFMPKHKFDMKALAKDARQDDATNLSSLKVNAVQDDEAEHSSLKDSEAFISIVKDSSSDAHKVLRAVQRSEPGQAELRYCFFDQDYETPASKPTPKRASTGPWKLLTQGDAKTREQHLVSGLLHTILLQMSNLPDELFGWILDEICIDQSILMRQEYYNLIASCPEQVDRLITPQRLEELFIRLGAREELRDRDAEVKLTSYGDEPYQQRNWACLQSFMILLGLISSHLSFSSVAYATQTLLLMAMDRVLVCSIDTLAEHKYAVQSLLDAIPQPSWSSFCFETCSMLHSSIRVQCVRINALLCLPVSHKKAHELRRRLAHTFMFGDPNLSRHHPDDVITIRGMIDSLDGGAFAVGPKTDFAELRAGILLLDMAVDDGSFAATGDADDEKKFNEEIDELALKLREIWRKINDSGMKLARTEAKSVIEWVQQRLSHSVRTRRKARKSVFDIPGQREDPFLPRQQDYMSKFLKKQPEPAGDA